MASASPKPVELEAFSGDQSRSQLAWHAVAAALAASEFGVRPAEGLTEAEARRRLGAAGPNRVQEEEREGIGAIFLEEIREPMILLLLGTAILYSVWGKLTDALTIIAVILALVGAEVVNEYRATRAITSLKKLAEPLAWVRRDSREREVPVDAVVPGRAHDHRWTPRRRELRVRHLPVLEGDELIGIVSMRDLLLLEALRPSGRPVCEQTHQQ